MITRVLALLQEGLVFIWEALTLVRFLWIIGLVFVSVVAWIYFGDPALFARIMEFLSVTAKKGTKFFVKWWPKIMMSAPEFLGKVLAKKFVKDFIIFVLMIFVGGDARRRYETLKVLLPKLLTHNLVQRPVEWVKDQNPIVAKTILLVFVALIIALTFGLSVLGWLILFIDLIWAGVKWIIGTLIKIVMRFVPPMMAAKLLDRLKSGWIPKMWRKIPVKYRRIRWIRWMKNRYMIYLIGFIRMVRKTRLRTDEHLERRKLRRISQEKAKRSISPKSIDE